MGLKEGARSVVEDDAQIVGVIDWLACNRKRRARNIRRTQILRRVRIWTFTGMSLTLLTI